MICRKLLSTLALFILVASTLVGCGQNSSNPSTLTILSITEGDVFVMKAGIDDWTEAEVGMSLEVGDSIKTGDDSSAEITFFDGSTVELQPGTEVEIASLDISADTGSTTITLEQTIGATISRVMNIIDPASRYEVETSTGVAAVRGSVLVVCVTGNGTSWIANQKGNIWTRAQGVELQVPEKRKCLLKPLMPPELMPPNRPPLAQDDAAITDEDDPVTVVSPGVLSNDLDPDPYDLLLVTAVDTSGTVGAVTGWGPRGTFTYDPDGQFEYLQAGESATDSFAYTVSDACGDNATATVTITINGVG
ncbi:MAG: Ig-like domain-containing protein [Dehalococcoidia bacterium]